MHNLHKKPLTDQEHIDNWVSVDRALGTNYLLWVGGTEFVSDPGFAGSVNNVIYPYSFHEYDNAADERAVVTLRRNERWLRGSLMIRNIWYSGDVVGNNFFVRVTLNSFRNNLSFAAPIAAVITDVTIPGPTAANDLERVDGTTRNDLFIPMNSGVDVFTVGVRRFGANAADTNTGNFHLIGIDLEYIEKHRVIGEDVSKHTW